MAEGGGLLNRCTVKSCTGGSNPPLSARFLPAFELGGSAFRFRRVIARLLYPSFIPIAY